MWSVQTIDIGICLRLDHHESVQMHSESYHISVDDTVVLLHITTDVPVIEDASKVLNYGANRCCDALRSEQRSNYNKSVLAATRDA